MTIKTHRLLRKKWRGLYHRVVCLRNIPLSTKSKPPLEKVVPNPLKVEQNLPLEKVVPKPGFYNICKLLKETPLYIVKRCHTEGVTNFARILKKIETNIRPSGLEVVLG